MALEKTTKKSDLSLPFQLNFPFKNYLRVLIKKKINCGRRGGSWGWGGGGGARGGVLKRFNYKWLFT